MKHFEDDELIVVRNRNNGTTGYQLQEEHIERQFAPGQSKKIAFKELSSLMYAPGGESLLRDYLVVEDKDALIALGLETEPEYFYTEADVKKICGEGTIDEFIDFLNFAPDGALQIAKEYAVNGQVPDTRKRELLGKKMNFNIDAAIQLRAQMTVNDNKEEKDEELDKALNSKERRVAPTTEAAKPVRRVVKTVEE